MRLSCRVFRWKAARWVALGRIVDLESDLHAIACRECAAYRGDVLSLDVSLRSLASPPSLHAGLEDRVWQEVDRRATRGEQRPIAHRWTPAIAGLALAGVMLAWAAWRSVPQPVPPTGAQQLARSLPTPHMGGNSCPVERHASPKTTQSAPAIVREDRSHRRLNKRTKLAGQFDRARTRRHRSGLRSKPEVRVAKATVNPRKEPVRVAKAERSTPAGPPPQAVWAYWGAWYEQRGDYARASLAYERARNAAGVEQGEVYTYEAGRAAECAGNLSGAVDNYSKMLSRASATRREPKAEKGAMKWTPTGNEA